MKLMAAIFWLRLGRWLDSRSLDAMAQTCYRFAANEGGKHGAKALMLLGKKFIARGALHEALHKFQEAVRCDPTNANTWCALGAAHRQTLEFGEARRCFDRALELDPTNAHALTNIGELHLVQGDHEGALAYFDRVLERAPQFYEAIGNRIAALIKADKLSEAERAARQAIVLYPDSAGLQVNLGAALVALGRPPQALAAFERALQIEPDNQEALFHQALLQNDSRALGQFVDFIRRRIELVGESVVLQLYLALALRHNNQLAEAEAACRRLLEQHPTSAQGWHLLAQCADARGDPARCIECLRKVMEFQPEKSGIISNILFESNYVDGLTPEEVFKRHLEWAERCEARSLQERFRHSPGTEPEKRLKLGYVSSDYANHPVGNLLRSALQQHDRSRFEVHCFSTSGVLDEITEILRASCDRWHDVQMLPPEELAGLVQAQGIDILVDLSGHTGSNRLPAFALKPAPVQATWIGYFHSTGLKSIDYFITDPYTTPQPCAQFFSETPAWLPHSRFCYTPPGFAPNVSKPPLESAGCITFGSFNRLVKLNEAVIGAWSRIMVSVPNARIMMKARELADPDTAEQVRKRFAACGVSPERLILQPASTYFEMCQDYSQVDIALDPFPFNGGMTTLDALWMGVPVVALAGNSVVSRQSTSMLINVGLEELVFADLESYVAGAVALALDWPRVARLRATIRLQMSRSPLCNAEQFTQDLETLYRRMWQAWCRGEKLGSEIVPGPALSRKTVLHVGCGAADIRSLPAYFQKRWQEIRLDIDADAQPDILGSALDMSAIQSASVDAVYSSHILQRLHAHELPIALAEIKRVLRPDGILVVIVPDLQAVARLIADDQLFETAYESPAGAITPFDMVYGHRGYLSAGKLQMAHRGGFTLTTLIDALKKGGFAAVTGKRRESALDLWVLAGPEPMADDALQQLSDAVLPA